MTTALPIIEFLPKVIDSLSKSNNLVLQAEPGAGKSTALPLSLLTQSWLYQKKIIMLEPRRVAAKSIATYLAKQLGEKVGERIGYQIKHDKKTSANTVLEIVTEGILTRRLQSDPELKDVALIIFDEFHERSLHADLSLMLALEVQQSLRDDLKLLVMSATIDTEEISAYLDGATIIKCPGRQYPVSVSYQPINNHYLSHTVIKAIKTAFLSDIQGDILVFLSGQYEIQRCLREAQIIFSDRENTLFLPLYGALSIEQQEQVLTPNPLAKQRVIFATNIAETSLTIDGVTCVIDSGLEKVVVYDPVSNMTRLETCFISKASAEQRKGRAGRLRAGQCIRLWSEVKQQSLAEFQNEEILSSDLTNLVLELLLWGQVDYESIHWLTPPPKANFATAKQLLVTLGLMTEIGTISNLGRKSSTLGLEPRLSTMLLKANGTQSQEIACELAALLSRGDVFYGNKGADIIERLLAIQAYKSNKKHALQHFPLKPSAIEQVLTTIKSLRKSLKLSSVPANFTLNELQQSVGGLLLFAYPERLAKQRSNNSTRYQLANGRGAFLHENDALADAPWLVVSECNAQKKEGLIYSAAAISLEDIQSQISASIIEHNTYRLDDKKLKVIGRKLIKYQAITLEEKSLSVIPAEQFQQCISDLIKTEGLTILNWTKKCQSWLERVEWLGQYLATFPQVSAQSLVLNIDDWLLPYVAKINSLAQLKKINLFDLLLSTLTWDEQKILEREAPTRYTTPSDKQVPIIYDKNQGPTVSVVLQEMFGEIESPHIAQGKVPLRFELLSPAKRPVQTTSDLANFWKTSYYQVIKDMRAKYPKHRWPEAPLLEKPGRSIKRKT